MAVVTIEKLSKRYEGAGEPSVQGVDLTIGDGARIAAQAGVMRDVAPGESVIGAPAVPGREFFRQVAALQRLAAKKGE